MNITCTKAALLKSVNTVIRAVSPKTTQAVLQCIRMVAENDVFSLTGNDLEIAIQSSLSAVIREEGAIAVNARLFSEIIRRLPQEEVSMHTDNQKLVISSGRSEFNIAYLSGDDFPALPEVVSENQLVLPQKELRAMIQKTIFSIATEDSGRPILTGEHIEVKNGYLSVVAVDGFRISLQRTPILSDREFAMTVPGKALNELTKILTGDNDEDMMKVTFTGRHILFSIGDTILVSRLLEGEFLNYERNLNMAFSTKAFVNKRELLDSIDRAALISKEGKNSPVRMDIQSDKMVITSNTEAGTAYEEVELHLEGEGMVTAFNPHYYMDALRAIEDDSVCILYASSLSPCIIQGISEENYKYFILPIRLN